MQINRNTKFRRKSGTFMLVQHILFINNLDNLGGEGFLCADPDVFLCCDHLFL